MDSKICFKCDVEKPVTDFYKHRTMRDGRLGKCKPCAVADSRAQSLRTPERIQITKRVSLARRRAGPRAVGWADRADIRKVYERCPEGYDVDHVIPLNGAMVSGLHVPENLQHLTRSENRRKHNNYV